MSQAWAETTMYKLRITINYLISTAKLMCLVIIANWRRWKAPFSLKLKNTEHCNRFSNAETNNIYTHIYILHMITNLQQLNFKCKDEQYMYTYTYYTLSQTSSSWNIPDKHQCGGEAWHYSGSIEVETSIRTHHPTFNILTNHCQLGFGCVRRRGSEKMKHEKHTHTHTQCLPF